MYHKLDHRLHPLTRVKGVSKKTTQQQHPPNEQWEHCKIKTLGITSKLGVWMLTDITHFVRLQGGVSLDRYLRMVTSVG